MIAFVVHVLGIDNLSGRWYGFWSGFGSDLGEFGIIWVLYKKHNCHVARCLRLARHPVDGTSFVVCGRHHPDGVPSHHHIHHGAKS